MMMTPEKIYLVNDDLNIKREWYKTKQVGFETTEYTRTDAFIDKALKFLDGCIPDYIELKHANVDTFMDVDNERFIKDFINHIKGE